MPLLLFTPGVGGTTFNSYIRFSTDQGNTWSDEVLMVTGGKYPRIATGEGEKLFGCYKTNRIYTAYQGAGDTAFSTPAIIVDETATEIDVQDDRFDLSFSHNWGQWLLIVNLTGETSPAHFVSSDNGESFTRVV